MSGKIRGSKGVQERFLEELFGKSMKILSSVYLKTFKKKKDKLQLLVKNAGFFLAVSRFFGFGPNKKIWNMDLYNSGLFVNKVL